MSRSIVLLGDAGHDVVVVGADSAGPPTAPNPSTSSAAPPPPSADRPAAPDRRADRCDLADARVDRFGGAAAPYEACNRAHLALDAAVEAFRAALRQQVAEHCPAPTRRRAHEDE